MRYLLDTNVVVWLLLGRRDMVPGPVADALADLDHEVQLSAASVWEIAIKRSLRKLRIADGWLAATRSLGFTPLPVTTEHAAATERLPWHHRDPFDRLLVAQAISEDATLVTADRQLDTYEVVTWWG